MYERHKGDGLLAHDPQLGHKWEWSRIASGYSPKGLEEWTHFQVSKAKVGKWILEAVQWGSDPVYYSSRIEYSGQLIASLGHDRETGAKTRIEAQIKAEKLLVDWITGEYVTQVNHKPHNKRGEK